MSKWFLDVECPWACLRSVNELGVFLLSTSVLLKQNRENRKRSRRVYLQDSIAPYQVASWSSSQRQRKSWLWLRKFTHDSNLQRFLPAHMPVLLQKSVWLHTWVFRSFSPLGHFVHRFLCLYSSLLGFGAVVCRASSHNTFWEAMIQTLVGKMLLG